MHTRALAPADDTDARLARVGAERRRTWWQRAGAVGIGVVCLSIALNWPALLLVGAAYALSQALEAWAFAPALTHGEFPSASRRRLALGSLILSTAIYGSTSIPVALLPDKGALALALLILLAAGVHSLPVSLDSRRGFLALVAPLLIYSLAVPAVALKTGGSSPLLLLNVMMGALFLTAALLAWMACDRKLQESRLTAAELERRRAEAEAAHAAKSAFVAMVSHELRTPLSGVLAAGAELQRRLEKDDNRQAVAVLVDAGRFMQTLLDDLLDYAKLEAGRMTVEAVPFDIGHLVWSVERHWRTAAREAGKPMQLTAATGLPVMVSGDPTRIRQVLNNLLSNALKFTGPEGVRWTVDACAGPECSTLGAAGLTIRVTDTGPGMTAEQLNRLFTAYDQTSESVARTHGGTGLGLAVSRELARRMGGDLTVESAPGRGSTFILHLPLKAAAPVVTAGPETTQVANELGLRILVVDDHPLNRRTLQLLLDPSGAQIATAEDARSALEQLAAARFDLVLTDVNMPGMCGAGLVRAIRSTPGPNRHTPVIAVTAATSPEEQAACLEAGMTGFVAKPIQPPALYAALNAALAELPGEAAPKAA